MPRIRQDNDNRYALRTSFVDDNGDVITGDTITISDITGYLQNVVEDTTPQLGGTLDGNGFNFNGAVGFEAKAGEALSRGDAVYVSGVSGNKPVVMKADADDAAKMPAFGIAENDANLNANVEIVTFGTVYNIDTSAYSIGDELYVSTTPGVLTATPPTGESAKLQNLGKVIRSHASAGSIKVGGAGRTNAVPNLNDGNVFIGNASNQAEQRALVEADISDFGTYLTSYTETDPIFTASAASGITATNITNWNTAYGWGDHSTQGYLTSFSETDTLDSVTDRGATTTNAITVGNLTAGEVKGEGPDGGMVMRNWPSGGSYGMIGTANMGAGEYALLTDGTNTFIAGGSGGSTYIRNGANDTSPQLIVKPASVDIEGAPLNTNNDVNVSGGHIWSQQMIRATGWWNTNGSSSNGGLATEIGVSGGESYILSYNRDTSTYGNMNITAASLTIDTDMDLANGHDVVLPANTNNIRFEAANVDITANSGRSGVVRFNNTASDTWTGFSSATGGRDWHYLHRDADCGLYDNTAGQWKSRFTTGAGVTLYYGTVGRLSTTGSGASTLGHHEITAGQLIGGVGAETTGGTTNWNDSTNARSGGGHTLLLGTHTNGPGPSAYFHPFSFEYDSKDGTGNMTQLAVPYRGGYDVLNNKLYMRSRYNGTWTSWVEVGGTLTTLQIPDANTTISEGSGNALRFSTDDGYVDVGPMNSSYCHFQTDRGSYYFNKTTVFDGGGIRAYDSNTDARFPLYYDYNDTSFYCDPASTSRLNISYNNETSHPGANGRGVRFWNSDSYKIYMSQTADATWGGQANGQDTSDYNMYFKMTGGTNRGFVFLNPTTGKAAAIDGAGRGTFEQLYIHNGQGGNEGLQVGSTYLDVKYNATGAGGIRLYDSESVLQGYWYGSGTGEHGFLDNDGAWAVRVRTGTNPLQIRTNNNNELMVYTSYVRAVGSCRSPIFYDMNNTSYYAHLDSTGDSIRAAGDIVAYYSDERLKDIEGPIENALDKVSTLNGFYYRGNEKAQKLGYDDKLKVGLSAQEVQKVLPEVIKSCPADNQYMTLDYSKVVPLLVEAIKELKSEIEELKK